MTVAELLKMTELELDTLFRSLKAGPLPDDSMDGTAIILPGTKMTQSMASMVKFWAWRGKVFSAEHGTLVNRVGILGLSAIVADVYNGSSWYDEQACIVIDYTKRSYIASHLRDEIRQLADGFYLGKAYGHTRPLIHFTLEKPGVK